MRFGLVLDQLTIQNVWANYEHFLRTVFSCFHGHKKIILLFKIYIFLLVRNRQNIHNWKSIVYCSPGDTSLRDFYLMTLAGMYVVWPWSTLVAHKKVSIKKVFCLFFWRRVLWIPMMPGRLNKKWLWVSSLFG